MTASPPASRPERSADAGFHLIAWAVHSANHLRDATAPGDYTCVLQ